MNPYGRIFREFNKAGLHYIVVGGVAMNLLGYPRFTGDIDILLALDAANLERMSALMKRMGYEQRLPVSLEELGDEKKTLKIIKEKNLIAYTFNNPKEPQFGIDVIVGESLNFQKYHQRCQQMKVWDIAIPVISIDDLINMKRKANRQKDIEDLQALLELKGL